MAATAVVGRDEELGSIQAFLAEVEQGPAALVLSGEPGIGKTILWEAGVEEARQRFGRVLSHRSVEAEALLAFTGLSDLLAPVFDEVAPSLAPPRRRALEIALLLAEPGEEAPDPRAIGLALLDVLRLLAESGPVVAALDDVQWLDSSSAGVLQIALRRLREERIGLLATLRKVPEVAAPLELERAFADERLERLWIGPLSLGALHHLLRDRLGLELTRPELARILESSAGNPFFALELGRELERTNTRPAAGQALRVPESLHELLGGRLARLPAETIDALLFASALARPTVELVAAAKDEGRESVRAPLAAALAEGVVELDGSRIRFANPLLASICYEQASPQKRQAVHRALAGAVTDIEERARHLALAAEGVDDAVAAELDRAAEHAAARGATAAAGDLCELAAGLTQADAALARQRLFRAANFHRTAGSGDRAAAILERLLAEVPPGGERADVLFALALTRGASSPTMIELCTEALKEASDDDARSARLLAYRGWLLATYAGNVRSALSDARAALEYAERVGDPVLLAVVIAPVGHVETRAAQITPGLLERGAEIEERLGLQLGYHQSPRAALARRLTRLVEFDRARELLETLETEAAGRGDEESRGLSLVGLSVLEWHAGRWRRALEHATAAHELAQQSHDQHAQAFMGRTRALVAGDLGLVEDARAAAREALAVSQAVSDEAFTSQTLGVLGRIELALGNLEAAAGYLRELPGRLLAAGWNDPTDPIWADAIETLIAVGELDQACTYLDQHELNAGRLGGRSALAGALRCRGLVFAAEGNVDAAFDVFNRALAQLQGLPLPLERGRTLLCLGAVRRQAKQKKAAREALEQALVIFDELGAPLWADKARAELRRISGRQPASDELTETESRVALLASEGRSNKEIATELFIGVSTVERHLSHVYRKLGVRSRTNLARLIAVRDDSANVMDEAAQA